MTKSMKSFSFFILSAMFVYSVSTISAASSTPTPEPTETESNDDASLQENIKERLKKAAEEQKDQVKGVNSDGDKRGFVGTVTRVSEETLTVQTRKGTQIISVEDNLAIIQDGKAFSLANIEIDNQVVVMGYQDGEDFEARRILVLKKPLQSVKKSIAVGTIKKIDKQSVTITTRSDEEKSFSLSPKVVVEDNTGEVLKLTDAKAEQSVLLITVPDEESSKAVQNTSGRVVRLHLLITAEEATPKADTNETTPKPTAKVTSKVTPTPSKAAAKATATKAPTKAPAQDTEE